MKLKDIFEIEKHFSKQKTPCDIMALLKQERYSESKNKYIKNLQKKIKKNLTWDTVEAVARVGSLQLKILNMEYIKRILFKVSNQLYLKLNKGCERAIASTLKKLTSERASEQRG